MSAEQQNERGEWVPAEPLPEPFGVLWGRLMTQRLRDGDSRAGALVREIKALRALTRAMEPLDAEARQRSVEWYAAQQAGLTWVNLPRFVVLEGAAAGQDAGGNDAA